MDNENILQNQSVPPESNAPQTEKPVEKIPVYKAAIAWCMLGLGFVFTHFAFNYIGGVWGGLFWLLFGVAQAVYAVKSKANITKFVAVVWVVAEVFCLTPLFCDSRFINFLAAIFSFLLFFYLGIVISGAELFGRRFFVDAFLSVMVRPFERFADCIRYAFSPFTGRHSKNILFAAIGIIIALPLTIVVVSLLASSDTMFESVAEKISDFFSGFSFATVVEILFAVPIAMYLFGVLSSSERKVTADNGQSSALKIMPPVISYFAVTPICLFYTIYIAMQMVNIANAVNQTLDYSEFARKGFFELCAIAVINLIVITAIQTFSKRNTAIRVYTAVISALSLGIIATAIFKMGMYIAEYGMTLLRVYTSWFMLVMAVVFVMMFVLQIKDFKFWRVLFVGFTAMFFVLCFCNVNGIIASYNISAYENGKLSELDIDAFDELGYSAAEPLAELVNSGKAEDLNKYSVQWYVRIIERSNETDDKFAYFSIPRAKAMKAIETLPSEYKTLTEKDKIIKDYMY